MIEAFLVILNFLCGDVQPNGVWTHRGSNGAVSDTSKNAKNASTDVRTFERDFPPGSVYGKGSCYKVEGEKL